MTEIVNGDGLMVKLADGSSKKIFLASIKIKPTRFELCTIFFVTNTDYKVVPWIKQ